MAYFCGIDIGSVTAKMVVIDDGELILHHVIPSGHNYREAAVKGMEGLLAKGGLSLDDIAYTVSTGYGAANVATAAESVTDISCCARGVHCTFPTVRTVVDVGGQASKAIRVNEEGRATNFVVSERCAAGSGRFLQIIARVLQVPLADVGPLSLTSQNPIIYTTGCAVFGESEAISRVAEGTPMEDIIAGVHNAIAAKISNLIDRVGLEQECALTGGGALDVGLVKRVEDRIGVTFLVPPHPQITAAFGAALIARERATALV
ncbi:MAG: acyl-CoA dehydratase activase [Chloroflexota bacterium]|nr:acyl-CoA dehydratase activase [Chloroflexota bacterium]